MAFIAWQEYFQYAAADIEADSSVAEYETFEELMVEKVYEKMVC